MARATEPWPVPSRPALLLPCLNEIAALSRLLPQLTRDFQVILCDNGSSDGCVEYARAQGIDVVYGPAPRAVGKGLELAMASTSADVICVMDCDGTVSPADALRVTAPVSQGTADFCVGIRGGESDARTLTHRLASGFRNALARRLVIDWALSDLGSVRAFRRSAWLPPQPQLDPRYGWNLDVTIHAIEHLIPSRVLTVPTSYGKRYGRSKITGSLPGLALGVLDHISVLSRYATRRYAVLATNASLPRTEHASSHHH